MKSYDVAIVGGGIIGGSIAFELTRHNVRAIVLDRQQPGQEASWAAAGMLVPSPETLDGIPLVPLARASLKLYPAFIAAVESVSKRDTGYRPDGTLIVFFPPEADRTRDELLALFGELDLPVEKISVEEARSQEPALTSAAAAALRLPDEGSVDNRALTGAVLEAAQRQGAEIRSGAGVTGLLMKKTRCVGVAAGSERILAEQVVIASGCYSSALLAVDTYVPIRPVRGQMVALRPTQFRLRQVLRSERGYVVPRNDGRIIAGSTLENAGFEKAITPSGLLQILGAAVELVPGLAGAPIVETWCGLRPDTPDHLPVLGPTDIPGLSIATGHYRNGILLAPITARLAREWLTGQAPSFPLDKFSPLRFAHERTAPR